jgi:hypothetical protein
MEQQLQQPPRRLRGEGSIYRTSRSKFLWIKYHFAGKAFRETSRTADPAKAARFLRQRLAKIERGESFGPQVDRVRIEEPRRRLSSGLPHQQPQVAGRRRGQMASSPAAVLWPC